MRTRQLMGMLTGLCLLVQAGGARAQVDKDNVVIVLDSSGSMRGSLGRGGPTKMEAAKAALKEVLKQVPPSTQIGLLVFSAANLKNDWVYPLGPRNDAELMKAIDLPQPGSGTPLGEYLKKGADRLLAERAKQFGYGTYRLLVVTDGEANDRTLVERYTPEIMARGITLDVIGVAMARSHTLATKVHSYRAANDPASLQRAIADVFAEVAGRTSDQTEEETFAMIAPIPAAMASAIVETLAHSGNQPIGVGPAGPAPAATTSAARPRPSKPTVPAPRRPRGGGPKMWTILIAVFVAVMVLRVLGRLLRGSRR